MLEAFKRRLCRYSMPMKKHVKKTDISSNKKAWKSRLSPCTHNTTTYVAYKATDKTHKWETIHNAASAIFSKFSYGPLLPQFIDKAETQQCVKYVHMVHQINLIEFTRKILVGWADEALIWIAVHYRCMRDVRFVACRFCWSRIMYFFHLWVLSVCSLVCHVLQLCQWVHVQEYIIYFSRLFVARKGNKKRSENNNNT